MGDSHNDLSRVRQAASAPARSRPVRLAWLPPRGRRSGVVGADVDEPAARLALVELDRAAAPARDHLAHLEAEAFDQSRAPSKRARMIPFGSMIHVSGKSCVPYLSITTLDSGSKRTGNGGSPFRATWSVSRTASGPSSVETVRTTKSLRDLGDPAELRERRHLLEARGAGLRPEVQEDRLAPERRQPDRLAAHVRQLEVRRERGSAPA